MMMLPENRVGYLALTVGADNESEREKIIINTRHIRAISLIGEEDIDFAPWARSIVWTDLSDSFFVYETMDEIIEQLGNVHPSLL